MSHLAEVINLCGVNSTWVANISSRMHPLLASVGAVNGPVVLELGAHDGNEWHLGGIYWSLSSKPSSAPFLTVTTDQGVVFREFISKDEDGGGSVVFSPPLMSPIGSPVTVEITSGGNGSQIALNINAWIHNLSAPHY